MGSFLSIPVQCRSICQSYNACVLFTCSICISCLISGHSVSFLTMVCLGPACMAHVCHSYTRMSGPCLPGLRLPVRSSFFLSTILSFFLPVLFPFLPSCPGGFFLSFFCPVCPIYKILPSCPVYSCPIVFRPVFTVLTFPLWFVLLCLSRPFFQSYLFVSFLFLS